VPTSRLPLVAVALGALVLGAVTLEVACSSGGGTAPSPQGLLGQLEEDTGVEWVAVQNDRFGTPSYLYPKKTPPASLSPGGQPGDAAMAFFEKYGAVFRMSDPARELTASASGSSKGLRFASFTQTEGTASVYGTRLTMVFDEAGHIAFVSGLFVPNLHDFATDAALSPSEALARAEADMATQYPASARISLETTAPPELTIDAFGPSPALAYSMLVSYASDAAEGSIARQRVVMHYVVDATTGAILDAFSALDAQHEGKNVHEVSATGKGEGPSAPTRSFPALATTDDGGTSTSPYYLQDRADDSTKSPPPSLMFVRTPAETPVLESDDDDLNRWDTKAGANPGSAVDAYVYLREADTWWQLHGRNGYDDHAGQLGILVHDSSLFEGRPCANNAFWDGINTIHVCPSDPSLSPAFARLAGSVDLGFMGHEYQHAVTQFTLGFEGDGIPGAINESLSDVFGEFISHDMPPNSADCVWGNAWLPAGARNMMNPHLSVTGAQPDSVADPRFSVPTPATRANDYGRVHKNDGIPNKAWSLMTFGGKDETTPSREVSPSLALGWEQSETVYVDLIALRPIARAATFVDLAYALSGIARTRFGSDSSQEKAVACAWFAVGVLTEDALKEKLGVDPCSCSGSGSDAGACDAGPDSMSPVVTPGVHCLLPGECVTYLNYSGDWEATLAHNCTTPNTMGALVASCPTAPLVGCCTSPSPVEGVKGTDEICYYAPIPAPTATSLCVKVGGTWSSAPVDDAGIEFDAGAESVPHC
jgi:Zn-dependent metalloprotease